MCPVFHLVSPIANCLENLEHDPEKHALGRDPGVETGFPRDKREKHVCAHIMLKQRNDAIPFNSIMI